MPELPEVETITRSLRNGGMTGDSVIGREIIGVELFNPRTLAEPERVEDAGMLLKNEVIRSVSRRAKYIHIRTERCSLIIHLRMSGKLRLEAAAEALQQHDRFLCRFADGTKLVFNDVRKFGRVWVTRSPETVFAGLGVEPLSDDFTASALMKLLKGKTGKIKTVLLDQSIIAGIGNIYADESLFRAGIHPERSASGLSGDEVSALHEAIRFVLQKGIEQNGASFDWAYAGGHFQNDFQVYQRTGSPCPRCGTPIERITVGQRGTHFCPRCQKPPAAS